MKKVSENDKIAWDRVTLLAVVVALIIGYLAS